MQQSRGSEPENAHLLADCGLSSLPPAHWPRRGSAEEASQSTGTVGTAVVEADTVTAGSAPCLTGPGSAGIRYLGARDEHEGQYLRYSTPKHAAHPGLTSLLLSHICSPSLDYGDTNWKAASRHARLVQEPALRAAVMHCLLPSSPGTYLK